MRASELHWNLEELVAEELVRKAWVGGVGDFQKNLGVQK